MEERIKALEDRVNALVDSIIMLQKNQTPVTAKAESAESGVKAITPTTFTKTAYIDDTEVVFSNVPSGNMTIFFDKPYTVTKEGNNVLIGFEPLTEVTNITISIL